MAETGEPVKMVLVEERFVAEIRERMLAENPMFQVATYQEHRKKVHKNLQMEGGLVRLRPQKTRIGSSADTGALVRMPESQEEREERQAKEQEERRKLSRRTT